MLVLKRSNGGSRIRRNMSISQSLSICLMQQHLIYHPDLKKKVRAGLGKSCTKDGQWRCLRLMLFSMHFAKSFRVSVADMFNEFFTVQCRIDSLLGLPTSFVPHDAHKMLSLCPSVQTTLKANKALISGDSFVFSTRFVKVQGLS
ncbi:hypothetical protein L6452_06408 [Arctium lappa]|uniref:Uncharacterized protein n=1 Tax=Arctium lappa TaxID=4217 RepID=A0ACB9EJG3_ARCLA|nr:hypothetical protein L6452_06408 [Arctium lappa]